VSAPPSGRHQVRGWGEALAYLALGTLGTLALAEVGFRLLEPWMGADSGDRGRGEVTILAEGDSFTYGIGGLSFPQQLETVLHERTGIEVRAINEGIPGLTSAMVADRLEAHLDAYDPDYVIVIVGENNSWNSMPGAAADAGPWRRVEGWLLHSRVYKFFKVATIGWNHGTFHEAAGTGGPPTAAPATMPGKPAIEVPESPENLGLLFDGEQSPEVRHPPTSDPADIPRFIAIAEAAGQGKYEDAIAAARSFIADRPTSVGGVTLLSSSLIRVGRFDEARAELERGLTLPFDPFHEELWFQLGHVWRRSDDRAKASEMWLEGLKKFPTSKALYWSLARLFFEEQRTFEVLDRVGDIPGIDANPMHQRLVALRDASGGEDLNVAVHDAFRADARRMIEAARARGVPILFSSYPDAIYPELQQVAQELGEDFIDLRPFYRERFAQREDYISPDRCHCNTAGYRLMAELFADRAQAVIPALREAGAAPVAPSTPAAP
jgi:lysophospholipase L1-like esterase